MSRDDSKRRREGQETVTWKPSLFFRLSSDETGELRGPRCHGDLRSVQWWVERSTDIVSDS